MRHSEMVVVVVGGWGAGVRGHVCRDHHVDGVGEEDDGEDNREELAHSLDGGKHEGAVALDCIEDEELADRRADSHGDDVEDDGGVGHEIGVHLRRGRKRDAERMGAMEKGGGEGVEKGRRRDGGLSCGEGSEESGWSRG